MAQPVEEYELVSQNYTDSREALIQRDEAEDPRITNNVHEDTDVWLQL